MNTNLTIKNSEIYGSTSSLYLYSPITGGNDWTDVKDNILDRGISIIIDPKFNFSNLVIDNVVNSEGEPLIYIKDSTPPLTITNAYQVIHANALSNTTINGLDMYNTALQLVIAVSSGLNIIGSNLTVNLTSSAEVATPILALRDVKITVEYSHIDVRPQITRNTPYT